ncbi:ROK family protein [Sporosarcina sp. FSL K6-1508]|uniref:ROK family protein n=1 Tax=Sporosarcina sp. FSL K6-1508 TaxID=2921553 RepID=UPI0030F7C55D
MSDFIVMDIGGTSFRTAIYTKDGEIRNISNEPSDNYIISTDIRNIRNNFVNRIVSIVKSYMKIDGYTIKGLGISFPGVVDTEGVVTSAATLWGSTNDKFPLLQILKEKLDGINIEIINDITAAGWRYINRINDNFCIITVSSGIGNKVFWNREVLLDKENMGGEIGHFYYGGKYKKMLCDCGHEGHIGSISSGRGVENLAKLLSIDNYDLYSKSIFYLQKNITTHDVILGLTKNDQFSLLVLNESIKPLAKVISFLYSSIGLSKFIIIGGFSQAVGPIYIKLLRDYFIKYQNFNIREEEVAKMIVFGENDDFHGLIGIGLYLTHKNTSISIS